MDDARVVLELPPTGSPTIWEQLSPKERGQLVDALVGLFSDGKYDVEVAGRRVGHKLADALARREKTGTGILPEYGIVPRTYLEAAAQGCRVGVCRQGAVAFAGLLGELGVPNENLRLVAGSRKNPATKEQERHIWVEVRMDANAPWRELDPTAGAGGGGGGGSVGLARALGLSIDNKTVYPEDRVVLENLLVPEQAPALPGPSRDFESRLWEQIMKRLDEVDQKPSKPRKKPKPEE
jgi:hypothetical protein